MPGRPIERRAFLCSGASGAAAALLGGCTSAPVAPAKAEQQDASARALTPVDIFIPGYAPEDALYKGLPALEHPHMRRAIPRGYKGNISMLTKFGLDGSIRQNLFPVRGHDIAISPDGKIGLFGSIERQIYVTFETDTLDLVTLGKPFGPDWIGGGHGAFLADGTLALTERAPKLPYSGTPEKHYGRVTLRHPETLKILGDFSTHGISPHEIRFLNDGNHAAIANYGSTIPPGGNTEYGIPRHIVEPSVAIVDIHSGQLVEKYIGNKKEELRHLCVKDAETIFAIQTELAAEGADQKFFRMDKTAYSQDPTNTTGTSFVVAPTVKTNPVKGKLEPLGSGLQQKLMRHGLSIEYDPLHDEVIASYPATHTVLVFDAGSGKVKQQIDCAPIGLDYPCGIALLPGQDFYVVTGYWRNLYIFERKTHVLRRELCHYPVNFGHSHIATA